MGLIPINEIDDSSLRTWRKKPYAFRAFALQRKMSGEYYGILLLAFREPHSLRKNRVLLICGISPYSVLVMLVLAMSAWLLVSRTDRPRPVHCTNYRPVNGSFFPSKETDFVGHVSHVIYTGGNVHRMERARNLYITVQWMPIAQQSWRVPSFEVVRRSWLSLPVRRPHRCLVFIRVHRASPSSGVRREMTKIDQDPYAIPSYATCSHFAAPFHQKSLRMYLPIHFLNGLSS